MPAESVYPDLEPLLPRVRKPIQYVGGEVGSVVKDWDGADGYVEALEKLPLGPNVAAFIGHSDIRTAVMGLDRATQKRERPSESEQARMERMLSERCAPASSECLRNSCFSTNSMATSAARARCHRRTPNRVNCAG